MASSGVELIGGQPAEYVTEKHGGRQVDVVDMENVFKAVDGSDYRNDALDMKRLGKRQEFKRNFSFLSTMGFISVYMATWEIAVLVLSGVFYSGGFAGVFWAYTGTCICYAPVVASLAEMESMAPTSGGQYHWVSEFAPKNCQKILSYASGWMSTLAWLASQTSGPFLTTTLVEVMIKVYMPDFTFQTWVYTLIMLAFLITTVFFNTWAAKFLPALQTFSLFSHVLGFFIVIIPLWVLAPKNSAKTVFTEFVNESGYSSMGTAVLLNQVYSLYCILGSDTAVHISEEVGDASFIVPRCMWWSFILNFVLGLVTIITMLFCFGPVENAINADIPYLVLFQNTGNNGVAMMCLVVLFFLIYIGNITLLATVSRETWAFARDKGLPGSKWITKMDHKTHTPHNAVYLTSVLSAALCLINLGSTLAFNIIVSLSLMALLSTYTISIGCVLLRRIKLLLYSRKSRPGPAPGPLPAARWSLGRHGLWINAWGFLYSLFTLIWCAFPAAVPVTSPADANWGPALWVGVIILAAVVYVVHGRRKYTPPVMFVEGHRKDGAIVVQSTEDMK